MPNSLTYEGEWWPSGQPENKLHGRLVFRPESGALLTVVTYQKNNQAITTPVDILGISTQGKKITLCNCLLKGTRGHLRPYDKTETTEWQFMSQLVLIGVHANENLKFETLKVRYENFDSWLNISGFKISIRSVRIKTPKNIAIAINKNLKLIIAFSTYLPRTNYSRTKLFAKQEASIIFQPEEEQTLKEFYPLIVNFQNFLTLAISEPTYPITIEGNTEASKSGELFEPVQVLLNTHGTARVPKALTTLNMLFGIKPKSKNIVKTWFRKADLMKPIHDLYFGSIYQRGIYLNNEFLNLVQALESYHRRILKNEQLPPKEYAKRVNIVLKKTPEYERWLKYKLGGNEPPLAQRLNDILQHCPEAQSEYIKDKGSFVKNTANTRNYLTHFDTRLKDKAVKDFELIELVLKLRILVQVCLFKELELKPQVIDTLVRRLIQQKYNSIIWS